MRRRPQPKSKTPQLVRYLKRNGRLFFSEVDGDLWASDSYWCIKAGKDFESMLADYNLPFEPMVCNVGLTVKREPDTKPPDMASIVKHEPTTPLTRATICGQAFTFGGPDNPSGIWHAANGLRVILDLNKLAFVESLMPSVEWSVQSTALKAIVATADGQTTGLLMAIRHMFSDATVFGVDPLPGVEVAA